MINSLYKLAKISILKTNSFNVTEFTLHKSILVTYDFFLQGFTLLFFTVSD
ncbi:hypothetical protein OENI_120024 [Oenococcus oeni]|nr:hypothetical protein OENI_120024 [Oenococcus oeni]